MSYYVDDVPKEVQEVQADAWWRKMAPLDRVLVRRLVSRMTVHYGDPNSPMCRPSSPLWRASWAYEEATCKTCLRMLEVVGVRT